MSRPHHKVRISSVPWGHPAYRWYIKCYDCGVDWVPIEGNFYGRPRFSDALALGVQHQKRMAVHEKRQQQLDAYLQLFDTQREASRTVHYDMTPISIRATEARAAYGEPSHEAAADTEDPQ